MQLQSVLVCENVVSVCPYSKYYCGISTPVIVHWVDQRCYSALSHPNKVLKCKFQEFNYSEKLMGKLYRPSPPSDH